MGENIWKKKQRRYYINSCTPKEIFTLGVPSTRARQTLCAPFEAHAFNERTLYIDF